MFHESRRVSLIQQNFVVGFAACALKPLHSSTQPTRLIVDGGKGQLNMAVAVLKGLGLYGSFDLIGIAKKDPERGETEDKIYKPGRKNPVDLRKSPEALLFLQQIRDEAHRYVISYHRKRRMMTYRKSSLVLETNGVQIC